MSDTISSEVLEATLILAPVKARQALMTTIAATRMFLLMYGRDPSEAAVIDRFIIEAAEIGCTSDDIQWLIDAGLIHPDLMDDWKAATHEHA